MQQAKEHDAPFLPPATGNNITLRVSKDKGVVLGKEGESKPENQKDARQNRNAAAAKKSIKKIKADKEMEETEQMLDSAKLLNRSKKSWGVLSDGVFLTLLLFNRAERPRHRDG